MQIEKKDGNQEKLILTAMITDTTVLARIAPRWKDVAFRSELGTLVGQWCVDYYERYDAAPGKNIKGLYESWASSTKNKGLSSLVQKLLMGLSDDWKEAKKASNSDYLIDLAGTYFNRVRIQQHLEALQGDLDSSIGVDKAMKRIQSFDRIEMGGGEGVDILQSKAIIKEAFESRKDPLIQYGGPLGKFFGTSLERDGFISFMGPEKRGKSFWLQDIAWMGMLQRRKVAYFEAGDMSRNQVLVRFMTRAAARPLRPCTIKYPLEIKRGEDETQAEVKFEERTYEDMLTWQEAWKGCEKVIKKTKSNDPLLRLSCHPNSTLSVAKIRAILREWEKRSWVPDVIVVDYADILAPPSGIGETRDQINATWKAMRAMSQALHCLVVTATQSDAASYKASIIDKTNFSEDKRKLAHTTGMIGINATPEEKDLGIYRLNWVTLRDGEFSESRCVYTASCLPIMRPAVRSCW